MSNEMISRQVFLVKKRINMAINSAEQLLDAVPLKDQHLRTIQLSRIAEFHVILSELDNFGQMHNEHINQED